MSTEDDERQATDIIVKTNNPAALDRILHNWAAVVIQSNAMPGNYMMRDGGYVVRCFGDPDFIKFAITNQGYGVVIKTLDALV